MKWVGQQIYDFISRFRNDVYLENISTGTIASGGNLGLDANNKIVKADTEAGELAFNGSTANGVLTYGGASTIDVESSLTFNSNTLSLVNSGVMATTLTSTTASSINVFGTAYGRLSFTSYDAFGTGSGAIVEVLDAALTATGGPLGLKAGGGDGTNQPGGNVEIIAGRGTGTGAGGSLRFWSAPAGSSGSSFNTSAVKFSVDSAGDATIAGGLTMGSTSFVNSSGVVQVATQGTIDHDSLANFVAAEHYRWDTDISGTATIHTNNITDLHGAGVDGSANQLLTDDGDGTVTSESGLTWDGDALDVTSSTSGRPEVNFTNTNSNAKAPTLTFINDKGAAGALNDQAGTISFQSDNASQTSTRYGSMASTVIGVIPGDEAGIMKISTASSDGSSSNLRNVVTGTGSVSADDVDVEIGYGTTSITTIAGSVVVNGTEVQISGSSAQAGQISLAEDTDNGGNRTAIIGAAAMASNRVITLPDATGTAQLQGSSTGQTFNVPLKVDDLYILYVTTINNWFHTGYVGQSFGTSIGSELDHTAMRAVSYVAPSACKVNKVTIAFYMSSGPADLEFQVTKIPLVDGSSDDVTLAAMTHNDINFTASANYNYVKTMTMTGASDDNHLSAGQAFTLAVRQTASSSTRILYGNCFAEIELT